MDPFLLALRETLPGKWHPVLTWDFIPWTFIESRHPRLPCPALTALLEAYRLLATLLDLETLVSREIPAESWGCERCGFCCTSMRPGSVDAPTYRAWEEAGAPAARFCSQRSWKGKGSVYRCWYHNGVRLMICPFMFINRVDHKPFCAIYFMGDCYRPSVCSRYIPRHETCTSTAPEMEPWESR